MLAFLSKVDWKRHPTEPVSPYRCTYKPTSSPIPDNKDRVVGSVCLALFQSGIIQDLAPEKPFRNINKNAWCCATLALEPYVRARVGK